MTTKFLCFFILPILL